MPPEELTLLGFTIGPGPAVRLRDSNGNMHLAHTMLIPNEVPHEKMLHWLFFHALITNSIEPLEVYDNRHLFTLEDLTQSEVDKLISQEMADYDSIINQAYQVSVVDRMSYIDAFDQYQLLDTVFLNAIKNYFGAETVQSPRLRSVDMSYWQISIYISIIEVLLGTPPFCINEDVVCPDCSRNWGAHHNIGMGAWLQAKLYDRIENRDIRTQYKKIIGTARNQIRHKNIHEGLTPTALSPSLPTGPFSYNTSQSVKYYTDDKFALQSVIQHLQEITRFMLLNKVTGFEIYPELRGVHGYSIVTELPASVFD